MNGKKGHIQKRVEDIAFAWQLLKLRLAYGRKVRELKRRSSGRPVRVLFLVNETAKWKVQSLFDRLAVSERYEPLVALTKADEDLKLSEMQLREKFTERRAFFEDRKIPCVMAYDEKRDVCLDLRPFHPDIVFYQQPWDIAPVQGPAEVGQFALTCYIPYYVPNYGLPATDCKLRFHRSLWRFFVLNQAWAESYRSAVRWWHFVPKLVPTGHTMLDQFSTEMPRSSADGLVIYAPHWSFNHPNHRNFENYSTFLKNGKIILAYAQAHPEIKWAFRPHPTLRIDLAKSCVMTEDEIAAYYGAWEKLGVASYAGSYVELFARSRALITDCGSFLTEYACTGKPIVHLVSSDLLIPPMAPSRTLFGTYYQVHNADELAQTFATVLERREDPRRDERLVAVRVAHLVGNDAAGNVVAHLSETFGFRVEKE